MADLETKDLGILTYKQSGKDTFETDIDAFEKDIETEMKLLGQDDSWTHTFICSPLPSPIKITGFMKENRFIT